MRASYHFLVDTFAVQRLWRLAESWDQTVGRACPAYSLATCPLVPLPLLPHGIYDKCIVSDRSETKQVYVPCLTPPSLFSRAKIPATRAIPAQTKPRSFRPSQYISLTGRGCNPTEDCPKTCNVGRYQHLSKFVTGILNKSDVPQCLLYDLMLCVKVSHDQTPPTQSLTCFASSRP